MNVDGQVIFWLTLTKWNVSGSTGFTCRRIEKCRGFIFSMSRQPLGRLGRLIFSRLHDHTPFRQTTLSRTPLDEGPARRRDLYLTKHNIHERQTSMPPAGFEPTIQQADSRRPMP
jgi:hypothetical protein